MLAVVKSAGLEAEVVFHIADQRALRATLAANGRVVELRDIHEAASRGERVEVQLSSDEQLLHTILTIGAIDGILLGWVARGWTPED